MIWLWMGLEWRDQMRADLQHQVFSKEPPSVSPQKAHMQTAASQKANGHSDRGRRNMLWHTDMSSAGADMQRLLLLCPACPPNPSALLTEERRDSRRGPNNPLKGVKIQTKFFVFHFWGWEWAEKRTLILTWVRFQNVKKWVLKNNLNNQNSLESDGNRLTCW